MVSAEFHTLGIGHPLCISVSSWGQQNSLMELILESFLWMKRMIFRTRKARASRSSAAERGQVNPRQYLDR